MVSSLLDSLRTASLLPSQLIPSTFTPKFALTISFPSLTPSNGSLARVSQVSSEPSISASRIPGQEIVKGEEEKKYTLMLLDPDAPTPDDPKFAFWRHWIVTGIQLPSSSTTESINTSGTTLTPYLAPGPKDESGPHRYLFLLFEEPSGYELKREEVGGEEFVERRSMPAERIVREKGLGLVAVEWMRGVGDGWKGEV